MGLRDYRLFSDHDLAIIENNLRTSLIGWQRKWLPDAAIPKIFISTCCDAKIRNAEFCSILLSGGGRTYWHLEEDSYFKFANALSGNSTANSERGTAEIGALVSDWVNYAIFSLLADMFGGELSLQGFLANLKRETPPVSELQRPGSGALLLNVEGAFIEIDIILDYEICKKQLGVQVDKSKLLDSNQLADASMATGEAKVRIDAHLPAQQGLLLSEFKKLSVGDVLLHDHSLASPLQLNISETGALLGHGYLGKVKGRRAIQLVQ